VNPDNTVTITAYTGPGGVVDIPSTIIGLPVVSIQHCAFDPYYTGNSANVTSVAIPDSVTTIDFEAFEYCDTVTNITFGVGVTSIGSGAFTFCGGLMSITADTNNPVYSTSNGILFDKNQTTLIQCPQKVAGDYTIPDSVTSIGDDGFYECGSLTHVTIGNGVTSIGSQAFLYCSSLTSVAIPDGVTSLYFTFGYCSGLTNVTIGKGLTSTGSSTFQNCTGLKNVSIPSNVSSIGSEAFAGCTGLTNLIMEGNVNLIGTGAFSGCTNLPGVAIPNSVTNIGASAFNNCAHLSNVIIPGNVGSVGPNAFSSCVGLTNLTIGNGVASIGANAFSGCPRLTSASIPQSVISIGAAPFYGCTGLTAITVDASNPSYSSVDGILFDKNRTTLIQWPDARGGSYSVPNSVTNIGAGAFESCGILTNVTIDADVTRISNSAFSGCTNLTAVYFDGNAPAPASGVFAADPRFTKAIAYYLPGTSGWAATFDGIPAVLWNPHVQPGDPTLGVRTNQFGFTITGPSNLVIVVTACTNLANPVWQPIHTNTLNAFIGTNGMSYFSDPQWTNYPARFYRFRSP
jgi:hypothetical protein